MSNKELLREVWNSNLPEGPFWEVELGSDLDKLYDAFAEIEANIKDYFDALSDIRNPFKTPYLSDLEKEYGIFRDESLSEEVRRMQLAAVIYAGDLIGSAYDLQSALDRAGFNVLVHVNNPPVDPAIFLTQNFQMVAGDPVNAFAGDPNAYAGIIGGYLLVNGLINIQSPLVTMVAGGDFAYAGDPDAVAGRFDTLRQDPIVYDIPNDPIYWQFVFFVGGAATRDPVTDELTNIEQGFVQLERRRELENIILKFKPMHSIAGMIVTYT